MPALESWLPNVDVEIVINVTTFDCFDCSFNVGLTPPFNFLVNIKPVLR